VTGLAPGAEVEDIAAGEVPRRRRRSILIDGINRALFHAINLIDRLTRGRT